MRKRVLQIYDRDILCYFVEYIYKKCKLVAKNSGKSFIHILYFFPISFKDKLQHDILKIAQDHVAQAKAVVAKDVGRFVTDYICLCVLLCMSKFNVLKIT